MRFICCIESEKIGANLSRDSLGKLDDLIKDFSNFYLISGIIDGKYLKSNRESTNFELSEIWSAAKDARIPSLVNIEDTIPNTDDFVPGTIINSDNDLKKFNTNKIGDFGEPI